MERGCQVSSCVYPQDGGGRRTYSAYAQDPPKWEKAPLERGGLVLFASCLRMVGGWSGLGCGRFPLRIPNHPHLFAFEVGQLPLDGDGVLHLPALA